MSSSSSYRQRPPLQVLALVSDLLDPTTLAMASCVSKQWSILMSSDHLWQPFCAAHFPSLSRLRAAAAYAVSFRRLYSLGRQSLRLRRGNPPKPRLSLPDLIFSVDIRAEHSGTVADVIVGGEHFAEKSDGVFRFDLEVDGGNLFPVGEVGALSVTWNVVLKGFGGLFTMIESKSGGNLGSGGEYGWFSEELPSAGCCSCSGAASGLIADVRVGLRAVRNKEIGVEKVSVGVLSNMRWRYVEIDDVVRYLQRFLSPSL